jgi:hypothetical protein
MNTTPLTEAQRDDKFVLDLADACHNHADWLVLVRFGMSTLLQNQPLLIRLIILEAEREAANKENTHPSRMKEVERIMGELQLRMVVV